MRRTARARISAVLPWLAMVGLATMTPGCATRYSPEAVRGEIARQRGADPLTALEVRLGRLTTYLIKSALTTEAGDVPFAGLREFELALYDTPETEGPAVDTTLFGVRGWEPVVRARDEQRSFMVLVRAGSKMPWSSMEGTIGQLVFVGSGRRKVVYGRLQGTLSAELPAKLGEMFQRGGPEGMADVLTELTEP